MMKRILLTLALAGSVITGVAACNNSGGSTTNTTAPLASTAPLSSTGSDSSTGTGASSGTESSAPLASPSSS
jgi:hypothetical protein